MIYILLYIGLFLHFSGFIWIVIKNKRLDIFQIFLLGVPGWSIVLALTNMRSNPVISLLVLMTGLMVVICLFIL